MCGACVSAAVFVMGSLCICNFLRIGLDNSWDYMHPILLPPKNNDGGMDDKTQTVTNADGA